MHKWGCLQNPKHSSEGDAGIAPLPLKAEAGARIPASRSATHRAISNDLHETSLTSPPEQRASQKTAHHTEAVAPRNTEPP